MPTAAPKPCTWPGCPSLVRDGSGRCEKHRQLADRQRGTARERGYSSKWERAREGYLRANPLCRTCQAQQLLELATVVDHIVPHKGDMGLFWDRTNWQPLCKPCHDAKTAIEDGGFGRARRPSHPRGRSNL
ncbi:MAG: HNH endonuclease signature motif containing protein [Rubrivivax sp.]